MRVAAQFMMGKSTEEIAAFLQQEYRGGMGLNTDSGKVSAWFDERGVWLARGDHARDAAPGMFIPWLDAADRIGELMDAGQFATNVELTETKNHYRSALAQSIWYLRHDFSEMTESVPLLSSLDEYRGGGFPEETARLAKALSDPQTLASITKDMEFFAQVYAQQRGILRFHYHDVPMLLEGLHNLETPWREYSTDMFAVPKTEQFITEDEVDEALTHGSSVSGGKGRIYRYFSDEHSTKERADFLREEYGIGGHSGALSNKTHSFEDHDGKGIRLSKTDCAEVTLSWNVVVKRIDTLVKTDRYLTEKEKAQLDATHAEPAQATPAEPESAVQEVASAAKEAASFTVGDLYAYYLPIVRDAVFADTAYQNACRNSDRENAMIEGNAAINRAVISLYDTQFYGLFMIIPLSTIG
ncbi:MAG: hypothetical protein LUE61_11715 [Clostridiales bacterium]|nr:hypothetical protein [Clostridiales bacterium]